MRPLLEKIDLKEERKSFRYFKRKTPYFEPYWHYHPEIELTFIKKGSGTRFVGDSILPFSDFDLVLSGENLPHHWVSIANTTNDMQEAYVFQFDKALFSLFPECDAFNPLFEKSKKGIHFFEPKAATIELIMTFGTLSKTEKIGGLIALIEHLLQDKNQRLLSNVTLKLGVQNEAKRTKISKATNYILEHIHEKLTVKQLADFTNMVPQSFCRWFKKNTGHSFITFINKTRTENACHYLLTTSYNIQHIAYICGFESISHFNRTFKTIKGKSPRTYRTTALK